MIVLPDIRERMKISIDEEPVVQGLIDSTIDLFETLTHRKWSRRTSYTQEFYLSTEKRRHQKYLYVDLYPIESITLKEWNEGEDETADATTLTATSASASGDYRFISGRGKIIKVRSGAWKHFVKATITGGYQPKDWASESLTGATIPNDIREGLIRQVMFSKKRTEGERQVVRSQSFQAGSLQYLQGEFDPMFSRILKTHTRRTYGWSG
tara:strand:+ start:1112 stop:1741 length:630 start_codon:yes stop_codon:yes gene_type:complete